MLQKQGMEAIRMVWGEFDPEDRINDFKVKAEENQKEGERQMTAVLGAVSGK